MRPPIRTDIPVLLVSLALASVATAQPGPAPAKAPTPQPGYGPAPAAQPGYGPAPAAQPGYGPAPAAQPGYGPAPAAQPAYGPAPATQPGHGRAPATQPGYGTAPAPAKPEPKPERELVELHLMLGIGNAVCDNEKPDSDCPVDGGAAFGLGGGWRFHDHFSVGLEIAAWSFKVREAWRGQLQDDATDVKFGSSYVAPFLRWYWFEPGTTNPYLQLGVGFGSVSAEAKNDAATYTFTARGLVYPLALGVEWQISKVFRLGPQFGAYLHVSNEICEDTGSGETCRDPGKNADGDREGLALPWRLVAVGTFTFGS